MYESKGYRGISVGRMAALVVAGIAVVVFLFSIGSLIESVDAEEIVVIQDPVDGELHWYVNPGLKFQKWGKVTRYPKRDLYAFDGKTIVDGDTERRGASIRFNDGASSLLEGSLQFDYPVDVENLTELHTKYGSSAAVKSQLIELVTDKAIFMSGPLLSSKESYSERRTDLINWAEDQVRGGIYQTRSIDVDEVDAMTGEKRTVLRAEIIRDPDNGRPRHRGGFSGPPWTP